MTSLKEAVQQQLSLTKRVKEITLKVARKFDGPDGSQVLNSTQYRRFERLLTNAVLTETLTEDLIEQVESAGQEVLNL